ncbi:hypothetical protein ACTFIW_005271 [Dictyostelium discoideum]
MNNNDNNLILNNIYNNKTLKINLKEFSNYKFKNFLNSLMIDGSDCDNDTLIIKKGDLPIGLQSLSINCKNIIFEDECIPDTLETLIIGGKFNEKLKKSMFTSNGDNSKLTSLEFGSSSLFNQSLDGNWIPNNLKKLQLSYKFNQVIKANQLPDSLTNLGFGDSFNQPLDGNWVPSNLVKLSFGRGFEQPIKVSHKLPQSLTSIILHDGYEEDIEPNSIPQSVTTLDCEINTHKKHSSIGSSVLNSVTRLYITGASADHLDLKSIPKNVTYLNLGSSINIDINSSVLPNSIETFIYNGRLSNFIIKPNQLPKSLKTFEINGTGCSSGSNLQFNELLPTSLVNLTVNGPFSGSIGFSGLETFNNLISLNLKKVSLSTIHSILPRNLTTLSIGYSNVDESLKAVDFPNSLTSLELYINDCDGKVLLPVLDNIPKSVSTLKLMGDFNQPLSSIASKLSNSTTTTTTTAITLLELGECFNETIDISELSLNLKYLTIRNTQFNKDIIKSSNETNQQQSSLQSINIHYDLYVYPINGLSFDQLVKYINYIKK